jgi:hypothetical protein
VEPVRAARRIDRVVRCELLEHAGARGGLGGLGGRVDEEGVQDPSPRRIQRLDSGARADVDRDRVVPRIAERRRGDRMRAGRTVSTHAFLRAGDRRRVAPVLDALADGEAGVPGTDDDGLDAGGLRKTSLTRRGARRRRP